MSTITQITAHAQAYVKGNSNLLSAEELRIAQTVNNIVSNYYTWRWAVSAGTDISVTTPTQEYSMAAADQNEVRNITEAWLVSGSTDQFPLIVFDNPPVPTTDTTGRPFAVSVINETQLRLYPAPDASYTLKWRFQNSGAIFAANTESYQAPARFDETIKAGVIWQFLEFMDDPRSELWKNTFFGMLEQQKAVEMRRLHTKKD